MTSQPPTSNGPRVESPRRRVTHPRVRAMDSVARIGITLGGMGVIAAVLGILVYLLLQVVPLMQSGTTASIATVKTSLPAKPLLSVVDDHFGSVFVLLDDGQGVSLDLATGKELARSRVAPEGRKIEVCSTPTTGGAFAVGFDDGSVQIGTVEFVSETLAAERAAAMGTMSIGERRALGDGYVERTGPEQFRTTSVRAELAEPLKIESGSGAVRRIDYRVTSSDRYLLAMRADGTLVFDRVRTITPLGGGKPRLKATNEKVGYEQPKNEAAIPDWTFAMGDGSSALCVWKSGLVQRYARAAEGEGFRLMESTTFLAHGRTVTAAEMLLGAGTLILGDDAGETLGVLPARQATGAPGDGLQLVVAHRFPPLAGASGTAAITRFNVSERDRTFVSGDASGRVMVRNMTSEKQVAEVSLPATSPIAIASISPKMDGLVAMDERGMMGVWAMDPKHPEASLRSLFGKVWYEGESEPAYVYQSSAGTDSAETKMSLTPLVFGSLKATVYALLFAIPAAVLAAMYTSEILSSRARQVIKPAIEMMASLPSVVLGFVAAMVAAPLARDWLPQILVSLVVVPCAVLCAAHLWQMLPVRLSKTLTTGRHLAMIGVVMAAAMVASLGIGSAFERACFKPSPAEQLVLAGSVEVVPKAEWPEWARLKARLDQRDLRRLHESGLSLQGSELVRPIGSVTEPLVASRIADGHLDKPDIRLWLDGQIGGAWPGWMMLMTPVGLILAAVLRHRLVDPIVLALPLPRAGLAASSAEFLKFAMTLVVGMGIASGAAGLLTSAGLDARDSVFGPFSQRNTLIVALVMGFAIIPIIYTISEDAMSSVPAQLRSASLGCGATRWQTAVRVVLPLALSGIFSACMIGLGRAVGETMIVLMATGNTPTMEWNIFSGFRTLAANIAVEMPEAPRDTTHYRVLFLAALCLFGLTLMINTAAEVVRQRVRRKGAGL